MQVRKLGYDVTTNIRFSKMKTSFHSLSRVKGPCEVHQNSELNRTPTPYLRNAQVAAFILGRVRVTHKDNQHSSISRRAKVL
jgi:hypothetical protein